jgi:ribosomal protein S18 acetylase RimI-like enzyme
MVTTQAPSLEDSVAYYRKLQRNDLPHYVTLAADKVAGWCDLAAVFGQSHAHVVTMGIALLPEYRRQGLGTRLLESALEQAWRNELTRIELAVRTDNANATLLYKRLGFEVEGVKHVGSRIDGVYHDVDFMALLHPSVRQNGPRV